MELSLGFFTLVGAAMASSFVFSGMEAGVAALSRVRIRNLMRQGNARAAVLHGLPGASGELSVDDPGGQHAGELSPPWR